MLISMRKNTRWTPLMIARLGVMRKRHYTYEEIVQQMQRRYPGMSEATILGYASRIFIGPRSIRESFSKWRAESPSQRRLAALKAKAESKSEGPLKKRDPQQKPKANNPNWLFAKYSTLLASLIARFRDNADFEDIELEAELAVWRALAKPDKTKPLEKQIRDSVEQALALFFKQGEAEARNSKKNRVSKSN
jgi:hypothetical protein